MFDFSEITASLNIEEATQNLIDGINSSFTTFYKTYASYLGGNITDLLGQVNPQYPADSLKNCTWLVRDVLSKAQDRGDKQLTGVQGVRITCSLINLPWLLTKFS